MEVVFALPLVSSRHPLCVGDLVSLTLAHQVELMDGNEVVAVASVEVYYKTCNLV